MRAGLLRHRVTLRRPAGAGDARSATGQPSAAPVVIGTRWASVEPLTGTERFTAQQMSASVSHRVRLRYADDVVKPLEVVHDSRVLDVEAVLDTGGRGRELELLCSERQPVGVTA